MTSNEVELPTLIPARRVPGPFTTMLVSPGMKFDPEMVNVAVVPVEVRAGVIDVSAGSLPVRGAVSRRIA